MAPIHRSRLDKLAGLAVSWGVAVITGLYLGFATLVLGALALRLFASLLAGLAGGAA